MDACPEHGRGEAERRQQRRPVRSVVVERRPRPCAAAARRTLAFILYCTASYHIISS